MTDSASGFRGKYFHIAGSASAKTAPELIVYAHRLIQGIAATIVEHDGGLVLFAGKEPRQNIGDPTSPALIFDWTAMEAVAKVVSARGVGASSKPSIIAVLSEKAEKEIPPSRDELWRDLLKSGHLRVEYIQPGARSGTMMRERQAQFGDVLICVGGGTGVEHLANTYTARRKPVIPLDLSIGASREDGMGGALRLSREACASPTEFFRLGPEHPDAGGTLLALVGTNGGQTEITEVVKNLSRLVAALAPPIAFYVRTLDRDLVDFHDVEKFFREIVDPTVQQLGYQRIEMGTDASHYGFMNVEIFETLHYAPLVIVDVTGQRANCFIELGYALGRETRVIVTAKQGTTLPFDQHAIPSFFWNQASSASNVIPEFQKFIEKNLNRPPLVL